MREKGTEGQDKLHVTGYELMGVVTSNTLVVSRDCRVELFHIVRRLN